MTDAADPVVTDATDRARYEAHLGDELAGFLEYIVKHGRIALVHTEVPPEYEGQGVASALVRHALDDARSRELRVIASAKDTDDSRAAKICRDIAKAFEEQLTYPGEIKVTVVRESRFSEVAR